MKIEYEIDMNDIMQFQKYHLNNSQQMKKQILAVRLFIPIIIIGIFIAFKIGSESIIDLIKNYYMLFVVMILWFFLYPIIAKSSIFRLGKKYYLEGKNKEVLCKHKITIGKNKITEETKNSKNEHTWDGIEKIVYTNDYIFIYTSALTAHVVPIRVFKNEDEKNKFINALKEYKQ